MSAAPTGLGGADRLIPSPTARSPAPSSAPTRSTRPGGHAGDPNVAAEVSELALVDNHGGSTQRRHGGSGHRSISGDGEITYSFYAHRRT